MEWFAGLLIVFLLLRTLEKNGDWFDLLQASVRADDARRTFEFNATLSLLAVAAVGFVVWLFVQAQMSAPSPVPAPSRIASASTGLHSPVRAGHTKHKAQFHH